MTKAKIYGFLTALIVFLVIYFILTNKVLVFEWFQGAKEHVDALTDEKSIVTTKVSLQCALYGGCHLTLWGYLKAGIYLILIPFLAYWLMKRRITKKTLAAQQNNLPPQQNNQ